MKRFVQIIVCVPFQRKNYLGKRRRNRKKQISICNRTPDSSKRSGDQMQIDIRKNMLLAYRRIIKSCHNGYTVRKDFKMNTEIRKKTKTQLMKDLEAAACLHMSYGHYKAYQRTLAEKRKARIRKARAKNGQ